MADVFISYSRRDQEFVRELVSRLTERGKECWVDWDDIPPTAAFLQEIYEGIEASNAFLFVISPDSARSEVCRDEIEHAAENNKRIVPLLCREPDGTPLPEAVASLNWIQLPESADLDGAVDHLVEVLAQDLDHVRRHTRTLQKAHEWSKADEDASLLLRGSELRAAEDWIEAGAKKEPAPTQLHYRYLQASRAAASKRQRQTVATFAVGIVIALALAVVALIQRGHAVEASHVAESRLLASEARSQLGDHLDTGALLALAAYRVKQTPEARQSLSAAVFRSDRLSALLDTRGEQATAVAFARTGLLVAAGLAHGWVFVYDPHGHVLAQLHAGTGDVSSLSFSSDSRRLVAGTDSGSIALWVVKPGGRRFELLPLKTLPLKPSPEAVAFGPDGRSLVLGTEGGLEWLGANGAVRMLKTSDASHLAVAPNGTIAFGGSDGAYVLAPGGEPYPVPRAGGVAQDLAFDPAGHRLALVVDQTGLLWSPRPWRRSVRGSTEQIGKRGTMFSIAFTPADDLATGGYDGNIAVGKTHVHLGGNPILSLDSSSGQVVSASVDGLALWNTAGSELKQTVWTNGQDLQDFAAVGRHKVVLATDDETTGATLVGIENLQTGAWHQLERFPDGDAVSVAASPDGRMVAAGGQISKTIKVWSAGEGGRPTTLDPRLWGLKDEPLDLGIGPDGRTLVEATDHKRLDLWALDSAQRPSVVRLASTGARVAFAPSGQTLAAGGSDGTVVRIRLGQAALDRIGTIRPPVGAIAFSPDEARVAATGKKGTVKVWRLGSPHSLTLGGETESRYVDALDFDPRGLALAGGDDAGRLFLWDPRAGFQLSRPIGLGKNQNIVALHFDYAGRTLLAGLSNGRIVRVAAALWDPKAAIDFLCGRLGRGLNERERVVYHVPRSAASDVCA